MTSVPFLGTAVPAAHTSRQCCYENNNSPHAATYQDTVM